MLRASLLLLAKGLLVLLAPPVLAAPATLLELYQHFHANPELSFQEVETSERVDPRRGG